MSDLFAAAPLTAAVLLAGGESRRMSGRDKGLLEYQHQPMAARVLRQLRLQIDRVVIVANRNLAQYRRFGVPVISDWDEQPNGEEMGETTANQGPIYQGPMRGIYRAQCYYQVQDPAPQWLLIAPCDAPHYPSDLIQRYQIQLTQIDSKVQCLLPDDGTRLQPLFALLRQDTCVSLQQSLSRGNYSLMQWLKQINYLAMPMPADYFRNINSPEQLKD